MRKQRSLKAIETTVQVEYLIKYRMELDKRRNIVYAKTKPSAYPVEVLRFEENGSPTINFIAELEGSVSNNPAFSPEDCSFIHRREEFSSDVRHF